MKSCGKHFLKFYFIVIVNDELDYKNKTRYQNIVIYWQVDVPTFSTALELSSFMLHSATLNL